MFMSLVYAAIGVGLFIAAFNWIFYICGKAVDRDWNIILSVNIALWPALIAFGCGVSLFMHSVVIDWLAS